MSTMMMYNKLEWPTFNIRPENKSCIRVFCSPILISNQKTNPVYQCFLQPKPNF